jgi:hypothetical protein
MNRKKHNLAWLNQQELDCWIKQQKNSCVSPLGLKNHPSSDLQFFGALTTKNMGFIWGPYGNHRGLFTGSSFGEWGWRKLVTRTTREVMFFCSTKRCFFGGYPIFIHSHMNIMNYLSSSIWYAGRPSAVQYPFSGCSSPRHSRDPLDIIH